MNIYEVSLKNKDEKALMLDMYKKVFVHCDEIEKAISHIRKDHRDYDIVKVEKVVMNIETPHL